MTAHAARSLPLLSLLLLALPTACGGGDDGAACVEALCTAGETRCEGNYVATCSGDGTEWQYSPCHAGTPGGYCQAGRCEPRGCSNLGGGTCDSDSETVVACPDNGSSTTQVDCGAGEVCAGGGCRPASCDAGDVLCGYRSVLTCEGGAWTKTDCGTDEICVDGDTGPACAARECEPESAWCEGNVSMVCDAEGRSATATTCGGTQVCKGGFCQVTVCGVDDLEPDAVGDVAEDASGQDAAGDVGPDAEEDGGFPPLEQVSKIEFDLNGVPNTFDFNAFADHIASDSNLKIQGAKGQRKIEINIAPIDPFVVGNWTDTDPTEVEVLVCYHDGSAIETSPGCTQGFSHSSIAYDVTLEENNGPGSRVKGTFSTTLMDNADNTLDITHGTFDVLHK